MQTAPNPLQFFNDGFRVLTGHSPLGWQKRLFLQHFIRSDIPTSLDIPTGLGKTSVMAVWLLALAYQAAAGQVFLPKRLIYVVNRRTVVDQATELAISMRRALSEARADNTTSIREDIREALGSLCAELTGAAAPLAISTLRGELADNREWQSDPIRPTIIIGTIDMIGSRLLFSGYGVSPRMRPFHAGLLGQDALIIHDEAHLTPAFSELALHISERRPHQLRPLRTMELSATRRKPEATKTFSLTEGEEEEKEVEKRLGAPKKLRLCSLQDGVKLPDALAGLALAHEPERARILIYVRSPVAATRIASLIAQTAGVERVATLTGTIRGFERDQLASEELDTIADEAARHRAALFRGFRSDPNRQPPERTQYLVCTSAGEVGVDLDADHMVCDTAPLDSMIQRFGRVNRLGRGAAVIDVVSVPERDGQEDEDGFEPGETIALTMAVLKTLPDIDDGKDASPRALRSVRERTDAFSPAPRTLPLTDILLDGWSMTRLDLPGRPAVDRWLHGVERSLPQLHVAWRWDATILTDAPQAVATLFDRFPIVSRERLRGNLKFVLGELKKIGRRHETARAVLLPVTGSPRLLSLSSLREEDPDLREGTIVLPPEVGGLDGRGMLDGAEKGLAPDVADDARGGSDGDKRRLRILLELDDESDEWKARSLSSPGVWNVPTDTLGRALSEAARSVRKALAPTRMIEKARLVLKSDEEGEPVKVLLLLAAPRSVETAQDSPIAAAKSQSLDEHLDWTATAADRIISKLMLAASERELGDAVVTAARWHDRGKNRPAWQKAIGNPPRGPSWTPLAKSDNRAFDATACGRYRHEFGSLREAAEDAAITNHPERDLILHLIAAHHGWARPHFERDQWDIADGVTEDKNAEIAAEAMRRFARLQRRFGHWGLAWLEALMRSADYAATRQLSWDSATAPSAES